MCPLFFKSFIHSNLLLFIFAFIFGFIYTLRLVNGPLEFKVSLTIETDHLGQSTQVYCHANNIYKGESVDENSYTAENKTAENTYKLVND